MSHQKILQMFILCMNEWERDYGAFMIVYTPNLTSGSFWVFLEPIQDQ